VKAPWQRCAPYLVALAMSGVSAPSSALDIDRDFFGFLDLNVAKSAFGPNPALKMGMVSWNQNGFAFAILTADGHIYTDGVTTRGGCGTIGLPDDWSCEISAVTSKHVHLVMKQANKVRRIGDIELLKDGTTQTTDQVFPEQGSPYIE